MHIVLQLEAALEEGLHAVTDNLAEVAHEAEGIVKRGSHALKGALSRQPAADPTPAMALAGASGESTLLQTPMAPEASASVPVMCAPCRFLHPTSSDLHPQNWECMDKNFIENCSDTNLFGLESVFCIATIVLAINVSLLTC